MKHEPVVNRAQLLAEARQAYGLPLVSLEFVPVGYASAVYLARTAGNIAYLLKMWPDVHTRREAVARLPLLRRLGDLDLGFSVPMPLSAVDGELWSSFHGAPFAVFPFIEGRPPRPWSEWRVQLRDEYARVFASLHAATPCLEDVLPPRETFDIRFEPALMQALDSVKQIGIESREGLRRLRDLLIGSQDEVLEQLGKLRVLRDVARGLSGPQVLCHSDLGLENLLVDDRGRLAVLDWDEAVVGPPEHDLHEPARLSGFERTLRVYEEAGGAAPLYLEHFAFYLLRRYLNDATVRILRILERNASWEEDEEDLQGIKIWGFASWQQLDDVLLGIGRALLSAR